MLSSVNGFHALGVATLLFTNHICTLARVCGADARFADSYQETDIQRSSNPTAVTAEANHALPVLKWSNKEEGALSGTGERRLYAEEKEEVQLSGTVGEEAPARSPESEKIVGDEVSIRTPDTGKSTALSLLIERNVDARTERKTHLAIKNNKENGRDRRSQFPKVPLSVHHNNKGNPSGSSKQWRMPARYGKGWKAFWIAGTIIGIALVASATRPIDEEFVQRLHESGGRLPREASAEDKRRFDALARLPFGLVSLLVTGTSFVVKWFATRKRQPRRPQQSKPLPSER